jgi:N-acetylglucosaminyl-diphospho-decaprenol L-rhamnosyltransferase
MSSPALGLVTVGYHSEGEWAGFFDSIERSTIKPEAVVVVENSESSTSAPPPLTSLPLTVLHEPGNLGYGAAANLGVRELPPQINWVVVCNPDIRLEPETLERLLAAQDSLPRTGLLGPGVLDSKGEIFPSARAIPGIRIGVGHALFSKVWPRNPWTAAYLGNYTQEHPRSVGWLSGSFLLINRDVFNAINGFDERFFMFFEDVDLGMRIKKSGHRNVYVPAARVTHSGAHSTSAHEKKMLLAHHKSAGIFLAKLYPHPLQWPLRAVLRLGLTLRARFQTRNLS